MTAGGGGPAGRSVCLVAGRFNRLVTERLVEGARRTLAEAGLDDEQLEVVWVPGAWELPWAARRAVRSGHGAVVALGCVVRGETDHFDYICQGVTRGLSDIAAEGEAPVTFGVLTCDTLQQALERAGGKHGNKGAEAAESAVDLLRLSAPDG